jgi:hypothetical protein
MGLTVQDSNSDSGKTSSLLRNAVQTSSGDHPASYSTGKKVKQSLKQAWTGPEVSRKLRLPDFKTTSDKVVSHTHRPPVPPPKKYSWYSFLS